MAEPPITVRAIHDSGPGNYPPIDRIVIHLTSGSSVYPGEALAPAALGTAHWFQDPASGGSAHYIHDTGPDEQHCVPDNVVAWHAPPNQHSIGQEICGHPDWTREMFLDDRVRPALDNAAVRTRELCERFNVPMVRITAPLIGKRGVTGHIDVSNTWHQTDHTDPGQNFPWDYYMAQVTSGGPPPPPPLPRLHPDRIGWGLPLGHYYGNIAGPSASHGGYYASERSAVMNIQRWLIYHGCTNVNPSQWSGSPWADGLWEDETDVAMGVWHDRFYPGQQYRLRCYRDDYARLAVP